MKSNRVFFLFFLIILSISFLVASPYEDCSVYGTCEEAITNIENQSVYVTNNYITYNGSMGVNLTQMTNISNIITLRESWLETWADIFYVRLSNLATLVVSMVGNWTDDKPNYYTKAQTDSNLSNYNSSHFNLVILVNNSALHIGEENRTRLDWTNISGMYLFNQTSVINSINASFLLENTTIWNRLNSINSSFLLENTTLWNRLNSINTSFILENTTTWNRLNSINSSLLIVNSSIFSINKTKNIQELINSTGVYSIPLTINSTANIQELLNFTGIYTTPLTINSTLNILILLAGTNISQYSFNQTLQTYNTWNDIWSSTYNATYDNYAQNVSRNWTLDTFNNWNSTWDNRWFFQMISSNVTIVNDSALHIGEENRTRLYCGNITGSTSNLCTLVGISSLDNVAWENQSNSFVGWQNFSVINVTSITASENITTLKWFNGLFNWLVKSDVSQSYLNFNGSDLGFNESFLNNTIDKRAIIFNDTSMILLVNNSLYFINSSLTGQILSINNSLILINNTLDSRITSVNNSFLLANTSINNRVNSINTTASIQNLINSTNANFSSIVVSGNVSASTGFFSFLGDLITRVQGLFVQNVNFNGTINGSGNINTTGNVTSNYFFGNYNWTSADDWTNFNGSKLLFNSSKLQTSYYNASLVSTISGTPQGSGGEMNYTYDGISYNVTEVAGSPGLDIRLNFTGILNFNQIAIRYHSTSSENHQVKIQMWNYGDSSWENYGYLGEVTDFEIKTLGVYDSSSHISSGQVQIRFYQDVNGNTNHKHYFDMVTISSGYTTLPGQEIDPLSWHKNINIEMNLFNITNISEAQGKIANFTTMFANGINISTWVYNISLNHTNLVFTNWNSTWDNNGFTQMLSANDTLINSSIFTYVNANNLSNFNYVNNRITAVNSTGQQALTINSTLNIQELYNSTALMFSQLNNNTNTIGQLYNSTASMIANLSINQYNWTYSLIANNSFSQNILNYNDTIQNNAPWNYSDGKVYLNNGSALVGIGVIPTTFRLEVNDSIKSFSDNSNLDPSVSVYNDANSYLALQMGGTGAGEAWYVHGANSANINTPANVNLSFNIGGVGDRMRILSNGYIGIGTTNPTAKLQVIGNASIGNTLSTQTTPSLTIKGVAISDGANLYGDYGALLLSADNEYSAGAKRFLVTNALDFSKFAIIRSTNFATTPTLGTAGAVTSGTADFVIDGTTGNVGIGTTSPTAVLDVIGGSTGLRVRHNSTDDTLLSIVFDTTSNSTRIASTYVTTGSYHPMTFFTSDTERMRILENGNVGIGTTSPFSSPNFISSSPQGLHIGSAQSILRFSSTEQPTGIEIGSSGTYNYIIFNGTATNQIGVSSAGAYTASMAFNSAGKVGINNSNPQKMLQVGTTDGSIRLGGTSGVDIYYTDSNGATNWDSLWDSAGSAFNFRTRVAGTPVNALTILGTGNVGIGTTSPSQKLHILNSGASTVMIIGDDNIGKTSASLSTSADTSGNFAIQSIKSQGSLYGDIVLNGAGGNVGIGTINPQAKLNIYSTAVSEYLLNLSTDGSSGIEFKSAGAGKNRITASFYDGSTKTILFDPDAGADSYINTGNVGIGTASPTHKLNVVGNVNVTGNFTMYGEVNMSMNNITSVDCIIFRSGGKWCSA